ncbi:hypothetical protein PCASD_01363 [Puccinia coronata f. sp. avenae]|uniref:Uncharacterized protein n=1 Tax=Puccinia coronata f. sp. avenae TaxID=200324 RepID=A0A2N5RYE8_9BASI|nr:hypothetical protein PCASD_23807 [Puccinia coronata f. sp. avenae]PLW50471.1 hypothetical protein PCASD_01363 [Puccinia coronata f. sp. avenae]
MSLLSCCLGRSRKSDTPQEEQQVVEEDKRSLERKPSGCSVMMKETTNELTKGTPPRSRSNTTTLTTKKSTDSSIRPPISSWCSVSSVINLYNAFKAQDTTQSSLATSNHSSPAGHARQKLSDISSILSARNTIREEEEEEEEATAAAAADHNDDDDDGEFHFTRPSYSDDPFAPPTPRNLTYSQANSFHGSCLSGHRMDAEVRLEDQHDTMVAMPEDVCLPNTYRLSKFDFNEWDAIWSPTSPTGTTTTFYVRPRNPSVSTTRMPQAPSSISTIRMPQPPIRMPQAPSPTLTYRPQYQRDRLNSSHASSPNTPSQQSVYSSRTHDTDRIPFPRC